MNAIEYRDLVEQRLINRVANSGTSSHLEVWREGGPAFRLACSGLYTAMPADRRQTAAAIPVGLSLLGSVNAAALLAPDDQPVIFFDWNLPRILLDFCTSLSPNAFAERPFRHHPDLVSLPAEAGRTHFFEIIALNFHIAHSWLVLAWGENDLAPGDAFWFRIMFFFQLHFILAHELGHVALGHLVPGRFSTRHSPLLDQDVQVFESNHALEFAADEYAFSLLVDAPLSAPFDAVDSRTRLEWIDALFSFFSFLEGTGDIIAGRKPFSGRSPTHPAASARQDRLRARLGQPTANMERLNQLTLSLVEGFQERWQEIRSTAVNLGGNLRSECFL